MSRFDGERAFTTSFCILRDKKQVKFNIVLIGVYTDILRYTLFQT